MISRLAPITLVVAAILLASTFCLSLPASAGITERISISDTGGDPNSQSYERDISADGRYVVFTSNASNIVVGDTNGNWDVFVRDRVGGFMSRVSVSSAGVQGNDNCFGGVSISADGRYVAFASYASNLVSGDTNDCSDIFVRDMVEGTTQRVSTTWVSNQADGYSTKPRISANGRFVSFVSEATNLVPNDTNAVIDAFVRDRASETTERVSISTARAQGDDGTASAAMSADGRFIAFESWATNLVPGDTNGNEDVFVRDRFTGVTERVSISSTEQQGNDFSGNPSISSDGRFVAFAAWSSNLVPGDANETYDVFVRDRLTGTTECVSVSTAEVMGNEASNDPVISANGRYVAFHSDSSNLVSGDINAVADVFVRDRKTGTTDRVSVDSSGVQGNGASENPSLSPDGRFLAFTSEASNLAGGDGNGLQDVFARDRAGDAAFSDPINVSLTPSGGHFGKMTISLQSTYRDHEGYSHIRKCYLLLNDSLAQTNAVLLYYDRVANKVYLKNDANTSWGTGYAPGTDVTLSNSQCWVYVKNISVSGAGYDLTINWNLDISVSYMFKQLKGYLYVTDATGGFGGWDQFGTYFNTKPQVVDVSPNYGPLATSMVIRMASLYRDANGAGDLRKCYLLLNDKLAFTDALFLFYDKAANKVYVKNASNTSWGTGYAPGTDIVLNSSWASVWIRDTAVYPIGDDLVISWAFSIAPGSEPDNLCSWMYCTDSGGLLDGWKKVGTHFTPTAPTCVSVFPSGDVPAGTKQVYTATCSDDNGQVDIYRCYYQMSVTSSQANAVLLYYDAKLNKVFLKNDASTSWGIGQVPGTNVVLENSQCKVYVKDLTVAPGASDELVINWPIELKASQVGKKLCQRMFVQDNELLNSAWHVMGYVRVK